MARVDPTCFNDSFSEKTRLRVSLMSPAPASSEALIGVRSVALGRSSIVLFVCTVSTVRDLRQVHALSIGLYVPGARVVQDGFTRKFEYRELLARNREFAGWTACAELVLGVPRALRCEER